MDAGRSYYRLADNEKLSVKRRGDIKYGSVQRMAMAVTLLHRCGQDGRGGEMAPYLWLDKS
jgi:hypothetical protein